MTEPLEETEPVIATVDHADIRGLITTLLVSVGHLPRSRDERLFQAPNVFEGYANTGAASHRMTRVSRVAEELVVNVRRPTVSAWRWPI